MYVEIRLQVDIQHATVLFYLKGFFQHQNVILLSLVQFKTLVKM